MTMVRSIPGLIFLNVNIKKKNSVEVISLVSYSFGNTWATLKVDIEAKEKCKWVKIKNKNSQNVF